MVKDLHEKVKSFPILDGCVDANSLSQSSGRILSSVISYEVFNEVDFLCAD